MMNDMEDLNYKYIAISLFEFRFQYQEQPIHVAIPIYRYIIQNAQNRMNILQYCPSCLNFRSLQLELTYETVVNILYSFKNTI